MSEYIEIASPDNMRTLSRYNYAMATEAMHNPLSPVKDLALAGFTHLAGTLQTLTSAFTGVFSKRVDQLELGFSPVGVKAAITGVNYVDMTEMLAYAPAGLNSGWKAYLDALCLCSEFIQRSEESFMRPYQLFVTDTLAGKNSRSIIGFTVKTEAVTKEREELNRLISELFASDGKQPPAPDSLETTWGKVVGNNSEFDAVCRLCNDLIKSLNEIKRDKLKENADRVSRVLTGLMRPSPDSYSSKTLSDIASGGVEYVSLLEFYSVTYYRALTVLGAIKNTSEHIRKTFGK